MSSCQARDDQCGSAVGERRSAAKTTARLLRPPFLYARACVRVCLFVCECVCLCGKAQSTGIVFCNKSETPLCHIATCTQRVGRPPWGGVRMPLGHWGTQSTPLGHSEYPLGHSEYSLGALEYPLGHSEYSHGRTLAAPNKASVQSRKLRAAQRSCDPTGRLG